MSTPRPPGAIQLALQPAHELVEASPGEWLAVGDDPQFILSWPDDMPPGVYRLVFEFSLPPGSDPCLFLDRGSGWTQHAQVALSSVPGEPWSCIVRVRDPGLAARLDPLSRPGRFHLGAAYAFAMTDVAAVLTRLEHVAKVSNSLLPGAIAGMQRALAQGQDVACQLNVDMAPETSAHEAWIQAHATVDAAMRDRLGILVQEMPQRPLVSIVLNLHGLSAQDLAATMEAMAEQIYPDWELTCHAPRGEATAAQDRVLAHYARTCSRVCDQVLDGDDASSVLGACRGEWVVALESGARPAPHALLALLCAALGSSGARLVYADEDCVDARGTRSAPFFKPSWDVEHARSGRDASGAFALHSTEALRDSVGPGDSLTRALRGAIGRIGADAAIHVPLLLFEVPTWLAQPRIDAAGARVTMLQAERSEVPSVALVIPTRDRLALLSRCVDRILESRYPRLSVVIVDNGSAEQATLDYLARIASDPRVQIVRDDRPFNYSALNNQAVARLDADIVGLVNNDIEPITATWLEEMVAYAVQPDVGAVGAMLYYPDDTIQHAGVVIGAGGVAAHAFAHLPRGTQGPEGMLLHARSVSAVTAACMLVRRDVYLEAGGLDERLAVAFNDVDFCLRLRQMRLRVVWTPHAELYHHESASRGTEDSPAKRARFEREVRLMQERWGADLQDDPAYHPAWSLDAGHTYALAWPARFGLSEWVEQPSLAGRTSTQWPRTPRTHEPGLAALQE